MDNPVYSSLLVRRNSSVLEITLNRPDVRNALDETLITELTLCIEAGAQDAGVRALLLRGAGTSFCAGADLNWMARAAEFTYEENLEDARSLQRLLASVANFPGVTIAAVQGPAIGGGAGLVAACDIGIALPDAWFMFSEVRLGLVPAIISPYVIQKIGFSAARALFVTAERIDAARAREVGLVQRVAASTADFQQAVSETLERVLSAGPEAVRSVKQLLRDIAGLSPDEAGETTVERIARVRVGAEGQEGVRAFLEKRKPEFQVALPSPDAPA